MEFKDYYQTLGVARDATQGEIKAAYRKQARRYHPDVSKEADAEERFKEVGEAYEVLKDPEKRLAYDQLGQQWQQGQDFTPPPDWDAGFEFGGGGFTETDAASFSDFFENLFGQGHRHRHHAGAAGPRPRSRGDDHFAKVLIDVEDAFQGNSRQITLRHPALTADGRVVAEERTLQVKIPRGVKPGQQIRLAGQGAPGVGGAPAGDLYLQVEFQPHALYRIDHGDIYLELPVAPWEAALGTTVKVPTPAGRVDLKIPPNSFQGRQLRLRGRGLPGKPNGDMFVVLTIALPPNDSEQAKAFYRTMARELAFDPRAQLGV